MPNKLTSVSTLNDAEIGTFTSRHDNTHCSFIAILIPSTNDKRHDSSVSKSLSTSRPTGVLFPEGKFAFV